MKINKRPALSGDYWWAFSPYENRWVMMVVAVAVESKKIVVRYAAAIHGWPLWFEPDWKDWDQWQAVDKPGQSA